MPPASQRSRRGFTLIEIIVALAIIGILAVMAVPSIQARLVREQIVEGAKLADVAKPPIAAAWAASAAMPADNEDAGLPVAEKLVGTYVSAVTVENGAIHLTFGNSANGAIKGRVLTLRPAVVPDTPLVPVAWVCAGGRVPGKMVAQGTDRTDVQDVYLPLNCRQTKE
ncbi:pilin [Ideonella sp. YS5]|uniref:pilin n=1 Tax=Ideonella sp. YS5 TaxID=3453714 RepID=UPI003EED6EDC